MRNAKKKVLIVDDSSMNRAILSDILSDEYGILEAENGEEAIRCLRDAINEIYLVLLDINMPIIDGFGVLRTMQENAWIEDVPAIMISAENSKSVIEHAYELGAMDYISRPFDAFIVKRRVENAIMLCAKRRRLENLLVEQIFKNECDNKLMITILSHIVEFRNSESGSHIVNINVLTEMLLERLLEVSNDYDISHKDIPLISMASSLHDIGKIVVPSEIINKRGKLTPEEFEVMKTHSMCGAEMLDSLAIYKQEPLVKVAYQICRWHHERYDGKGYPDGLKGDEIPITAQVVSIADVYDALTSVRCYKEAYSHEKAMSMILNGECGVFNPVLLKCLEDISTDIQRNLEKSPEDFTFPFDGSGYGDYKMAN